FFQAEDGIRYLIVTGVQTCALPILLAGIGLLSVVILLVVVFDRTSARLKLHWNSVWGRIVATTIALVFLIAVLYVPGLAGQRLRSEERRVGKEGGGRWRACCSRLTE